MTRIFLFALVFCLFVSAVAMVYVRHQHRLEYVHLSKLAAERDELVIEWYTLKTEESTWSSQQQVEQKAKQNLGMRAPSAKQIVSVN